MYAFGVSIGGVYSDPLPLQITVCGGENFYVLDPSPIELDVPITGDIVYDYYANRHFSIGDFMWACGVYVEYIETIYLDDYPNFFNVV